MHLCLLPVGADGDAEEVARAAAARLRARGLRVRMDAEGSLGNRVRLARGRRDALLGVVGAAEAAAGLVAVTDPATGVRATLPLEDLADRMAAARGGRAPRVALG